MKAVANTMPTQKDISNDQEATVLSVNLGKGYKEAIWTIWSPSLFSEKDYSQLEHIQDSCQPPKEMKSPASSAKYSTVQYSKELQKPENCISDSAGHSYPFKHQWQDNLKNTKWVWFAWKGLAEESLFFLSTLVSLHKFLQLNLNTSWDVWNNRFWTWTCLDIMHSAPIAKNVQKHNTNRLLVLIATRTNGRTWDHFFNS